MVVGRTHREPGTGANAGRCVCKSGTATNPDLGEAHQHRCAAEKKPFTHIGLVEFCPAGYESVFLVPDKPDGTVDMFDPRSQFVVEAWSPGRRRS